MEFLRKKTEVIKDDDNSTKVSMNRWKSKTFGSGAVGSVRTENIKIGSKYREFVLKSFGTGDKNIMLERAVLAKDVYKTYLKLKEIKLPHLISTFRLIEKDSNSEILMTNLNTDTHFAFGGNISTHNKLREESLIQHVENWEEIIDEMLKTVDFATSNNIALSGDCWFLSVPKDGENVELGITVADLDMVIDMTNPPQVSEDLAHIEQIVKQHVASYWHSAYDRLIILFVIFLSKFMVKDTELVTKMWGSMFWKISNAAKKNGVKMHMRGEYHNFLQSKGLLNRSLLNNS